MDNNINALKLENIVDISKIHSLMATAKIISEKNKPEFDHDGKDKKKPKSFKGKGPSLNEKISDTKINQWVT